MNPNTPERSEKLVSVGARVILWGCVFGALFVLRSFFLLIFLTFVFAYIQANGVARLEKTISNRSARVVLVALGLLGILISVGAFLAPRVKDEATLFADRYPRYLLAMDTALYQMGKRYAVVQGMLPDGFHPVDPATGSPEISSFDPRFSPSASIAQQLLGLDDEQTNGHDLRQTVGTLRNIGSYLLSIGSAFLLSLLFSFLIVLDLPRLAASVRGLQRTKLAFIYDEVADSIRDFGLTLGRALEAQLLIALLNSILTGIGLTLLGLTGKASFLLVVVFLCSFIPVAGVFISSVPICLVALQESGVQLLLFSIIMITTVHMIEAYILNPKIYGHHMRMNPVIVLIILTIGGKLFHVWGLVLGVPVCTYIFGHAIRRK